MTRHYHHRGHGEQHLASVVDDDGLDVGADAALPPPARPLAQTSPAGTSAPAVLQSAAATSATQGAPAAVTTALANGAAVAAGVTPPAPAPQGHAAVATLATAAQASANQGDHPAVTATLATAAAVATPGAVPALKAAGHAAQASGAPAVVVAALKNEAAAAVGAPPPHPVVKGPAAAAALVQATNESQESGAHPAVTATLAKAAIVADPKVASGAAGPYAGLPGAPDHTTLPAHAAVMPPGVTSSGAPPSPPQATPPPPPVLAKLPPKQVEGVVAGVLSRMKHHGTTALEPGEYLEPGEVLSSHRKIGKSPRFKLVFQNDGDLVLYHHVTPIWASHTRGLGGVRVTMTPQGCLLMTGRGGESLWSTGTRCPGAFAVLEDNGNFVVYDGKPGETGRALWASHQDHLARGETQTLDGVGNVFAGGARGGSFGAEGRAQVKERHGQLLRRMGEAMRDVIDPDHRRGWELAMHTSSGLYSPEEISRTLAGYSRRERAGFAAGVAMKKGMTHPDFAGHLQALGAPREAAVFGWDQSRRREREEWMRLNPGQQWPGEFEVVQVQGAPVTYDSSYQAQAAADAAAGITAPPAIGANGLPITDPGYQVQVFNPPYVHSGYGMRRGGFFRGDVGRDQFGVPQFGIAQFGHDPRGVTRGLRGRGPGDRADRRVRGQQVRGLADPYSFPDGTREKLPREGFHNWAHRTQWEMGARYAWGRKHGRGRGERDQRGGRAQETWPEPSILTMDQQLAVGQSLYSPTGNVRLTLQGDGNLVLYDANANPLWASNTVGSGAAYAVEQASDGNFVVYNAQNGPVWASGITGFASPGAQLRVQDDGNLVIYNAQGQAVWASNTSTAVSNPALQVQLALDTTSGVSVSGGVSSGVNVNVPNLLQGQAQLNVGDDLRSPYQLPDGQIVDLPPGGFSDLRSRRRWEAERRREWDAHRAALLSAQQTGAPPPPAPHWWDYRRYLPGHSMQPAAPAYDPIAAQAAADYAAGITPPPLVSAEGDPLVVPFTFPDGTVVNLPPGGFPDWNARLRWEADRRNEWRRRHPDMAPMAEPSLVAPFLYPDGSVEVLPPQGFHDWNERHSWEEGRRHDWDHRHPEAPMAPQPPAMIGPRPVVIGGQVYPPSSVHVDPSSGHVVPHGQPLPPGAGGHPGGHGSGGQAGGQAGGHGGGHAAGSGAATPSGGTVGPVPAPVGPSRPTGSNPAPQPPHVYQPGAPAALLGAAQKSAGQGDHPSVANALENAAAVGSGKPPPHPAPVGPTAAGALSAAADAAAQGGAPPAVSAVLGTSAAHAASVPNDPDPSTGASGHAGGRGGHGSPGTSMHGELTVTHGDVTFRHGGSPHGIDGIDGGYYSRHASGDFPDHLPDQGRRQYGDMGIDGTDGVDGGYYRHGSGDFPSRQPDHRRRSYGDFGADSPAAVQNAQTLQAAGVAIGLGSSLLGPKAAGGAVDVAASHPHSLDGLIRTGYGRVWHTVKGWYYHLVHPSKKARMPDGSVVTTLAPIQITGHAEKKSA